MEENTFLGQGKISKLLLKFSLPCILSLLISALYNIVDQIFIGNSKLGYLGNAATGIVFPLTIIAQAFAWCFGDGSAAYLSICQGRGNTSRSHKCVGTAIEFTLLFGVILLTVGYGCMDGILRLFGASDNTIGLSVDYFTIVLAFFPVFMLFNMLNAVIRADGSPAFSMLSMASGAVINIILDPVFIFACDFGIKGAAWATVIGQSVSFIICIVYFFRSKTFRLRAASFIPAPKVFGSAVKLGISTFITQMSIVVISLVCNIVLFKYGSLSKYGPDIPISVISVETKVFTVIINIVVGIVLGGQPIVGYNMGAQKFDRVKQTYRDILIATLFVGLVATLIIEIFPKAVVSIFGNGDELYFEFAIMTFRIFLSLVTLTCFIKMTSIFFQAVGHPIKAAAVSLSRDIVCFVPLVTTLPLAFGIQGALYAAPAADIIAGIVAAVLTVVFFRKLKNV